jgi:hypothetical protein
MLWRTVYNVLKVINYKNTMLNTVVSSFIKN